MFCVSTFSLLHISDIRDSLVTAPHECGVGEFQCANFQCIDREFVCDGEEDCTDGSDEPDGCGKLCLFVVQCTSGKNHDITVTIIYIKDICNIIL